MLLIVRAPYVHIFICDYLCECIPIKLNFVSYDFVIASSRAPIVKALIVDNTIQLVDNTI